MLFEILLEFLYKSLALSATIWAADYLSSEYLEALIEFTRGYITVIELQYSEQRDSAETIPLRFADVHYFFNEPSSKPQHHRFDRGSYVYLFHNEAENRVKLEVANHAGTPDQDAFSGYLDATHIRYSHKQPNLFTVVVDGTSLKDHSQWHLPSFNEKNEQKYLYKINTIDVYLWTEKDAATFLRLLNSVLPAQDLEIRDAPASVKQPAEHKDSMSPVVQQLERTAISPNFTPQRQESIASQHSLPGSPPVASPQPAPGAYNPAAPAAPEPISYREKTPPPVDAASGTGLGNAARYDSVPQSRYTGAPNTFQSSHQYTPQQSYFSGPPQQQQSAPSFPGPPQRTSSGPDQRPQSGSFPPPPPNQPNVSRQQSFGPTAQQFSGYPQQQRTPSFGPNAVSSPGLPGPHQSPPPPQSSSLNQQGTYGYSNYNYVAAPSGQPYEQRGGYSGDMHSQVYRPTEEELTAHEQAHGSSQSQRKPSESRQKIEDKVGKVEANVGRYLKKLDKLW